MTIDFEPALLPNLLAAPLASPPRALILQESPAPAPGPVDGSQPSPNPLGNMLVPLLLIFAIFYFVMIGPERKARKKREAMLSQIKKGDKVLTTGGMFAVVAALQDDAVTLQIDEGVRVRFSRSAIQTVLDAEGGPTKEAATKDAPVKGRK